jgi:hypothetical protein
MKYFSDNNMKYFSFVGSYEGCLKRGRLWVRCKNLNYIDKTGWDRHQGPPTPGMLKALAGSIVFDFSKKADCIIAGFKPL